MDCIKITLTIRLKLIHTWGGDGYFGCNASDNTCHKFWCHLKIENIVLAVLLFNHKKRWRLYLFLRFMESENYISLQFNPFFYLRRVVVKLESTGVLVYGFSPKDLIVNCCSRTEVSS